MKERMGMKTSKKVAIVLGSFVVILVALFIFSLFWEGKPKELIAEADKFQPPSTWLLKNEHVEPIRLICLGDYACPSLDRHWTIGKDINLQQLSSAVEKTHWSNFALSDCDNIKSKLENKEKYLCSLNTTSKGYPIQFYLNRSDNDETTIEASLFLSRS